MSLLIDFDKRIHIAEVPFMTCLYIVHLKVGISLNEYTYENHVTSFAGFCMCRARQRSPIKKLQVLITRRIYNLWANVECRMHLFALLA